MLHCAVEDMDLLTPPVTVAGDAGKRWVVAGKGGVATGAWAGHENKIAICVGATLWAFATPYEGVRIAAKDEDYDFRFNGATWERQLTSNGDSAEIAGTGAVSFIGYSYSATGGGTQFRGNKGRGTAEAPTQAVTGDTIVTVQGRVRHNAGDWSGNAGDFRFILRETPTPTANGTSFGVRIIPLGSTTPSTALDIDTSRHWLPGTDNVQNIGSASLRMAVVYAGTGAINTSDARQKTDIEALTEAELFAARDIARSLGTYRWLAMIAEKGEAARLHVGTTVQTVIAIMESHGLDPLRYGFVCYDAWEARTEPAEYEPVEDAKGRVVIGEDGQPVMREVVPERFIPAGDSYGLRMTELLAFIAAGQEARLSALEGDV
jgi:hypothetical protein